MKKARVIMDGESQLVELPEDCHIDAEEVSVVKEGDVVLLIPKTTDWKTFFAAIDMAFKLILPFIEASHQRGIRFLHVDQHGIVDGIPMETGHDPEILGIAVAGEQILDALLDALRNLF